MAQPIIVDLPHDLGKEEARRRIDANIGKLKDHIPGGSAEVAANWAGDTLDLNVGALGQSVDAAIDVRETIVRVEVVLPGLLGMFGEAVAGMLRAKGPALLEDSRKKKD
ncbi:MAG: polyhydroxyalkanoic acid system family protein [Sphingomonadaceae bacterium]